MARISIAAGFAAALLSSIAIGHAEVPGPIALRIAPGQSVQQALFQARMRPGLGAQGSHQPPVRDAQSFAPSISAGAVLSGTLTVGQAGSIPKLSFTFKTDAAGLSGVQFVFTAPDGVQQLSLQYVPQDFTKGGTVTFSPNVNAPFYAQPGQWALTSASVQDTQYNSTYYDQAQLATLITNPSVTVVNSGPVDTMAPVVTAGQILTNKVSLSKPIPIFKATLTGTDDVSGLTQAYVLIRAPGAGFSQVYFYPTPIPTLAGTLNAYSPIFTGQPTGTWSVTGYVLCDIAGNCFSDSSADDVTALFGTSTFEVVN